MATFMTGHVGLNVSDLGGATRFYQDVFGFRTMLESREPGRAFAFLGRDDEIVLTLWEQADGGFAPDRAGLHHLSFQVETMEDVRDAERRLRAMGVTIHHDGIVPHAEGEDSGGIFFDGPDGVRLEIFTATGAAAGASAPHGGAPTCGFF